MKIEKYNIVLRTVEENDASLIIDFRTDLKRKRFISETSADIDVQKNWIKNYKQREILGKEYYFVAIDQRGVTFATYRIYDLKEDICEIGSWVSAPGYANPSNSIKLDIIIKEFVFDHLKYQKLKFSVFKENQSVVKYHKLFEPEIVEETTDNLIFQLSKKKFEENRNRIFKNIK